MPAHCPLPAVPAAFPQPLLFSLSGFNKNKQKPLFFSFKKQTRFLFSRSLPNGCTTASPSFVAYSFRNNKACDLALYQLRVGPLLGYFLRHAVSAFSTISLRFLCVNSLLALAY